MRVRALERPTRCFVGSAAWTQIGEEVLRIPLRELKPERLDQGPGSKRTGHSLALA